MKKILNILKAFSILVIELTKAIYDEFLVSSKSDDTAVDHYHIFKDRHGFNPASGLPTVNGIDANGDPIGSSSTNRNS